MRSEGPMVLVVDDEEDTCRNLADILGDVGCHVDIACDGLTALEMVRRTPYDVALLDLKMPGMNGLDLCQAIRDVRSGTVAILVTGYASNATAEAAQVAGAWQIVAKPVNLPGLLRLVELAVGQPTVLVVDDDKDLCANLWDLFRERGYRISIAHDAGEAARHLAEGQFRVVLIDMRLPGGSGDDVFRLVRAADPQARTVLITGHRSETGGLIEGALREGADAVCYKPLDMASLFSAVQYLANAVADRSDAGAAP